MENLTLAFHNMEKGTSTSVIFWVTLSTFLTLILWGVRKLASKNVSLKQFLKEYSLSPYLLELIKKTHILFIWTTLFYLTADLFLKKSTNSSPFFEKLFIITLGAQFLIWGNTFVSLFLDQILVRKVSKGSEVAARNLFAWVLKTLLFTAVILSTLDNLNINVTTLITGLGIGGIAVALAVQNILGDLFSSLTIILDKPFQSGDFISTETESGTVETIGIKTTRIRSLTGEELVFSNSDLLKSRIRNYKRMQKRYIIFKISIKLETPIPVLEKIPTLLKELFENEKGVLLDRIHLRTINDWSFDYECAYWVLDPNLKAYLEAQEKINFQLLKEFQKQGIEFAYPTQVRYVYSTPAAHPDPH